MLDTAPLGLDPEIFDHVPELDRVLLQMIGKLDLPAPQMTGCDPTARQAFDAAEELWAEVDADYKRAADAWLLAKHAFRDVARRPENAGDPLVSDAWVGIAQSICYQKGRRDDLIAAAVIALYWNRSNRDARVELFDLAGAAPHVPTLLELFRRVPADARPGQLTALIALSRRRDRLANMYPEAGQQLRVGLADILESDNDTLSIKKLATDARRHAGNKRGR